jgi:hypothetical protein
MHPIANLGGTPDWIIIDTPPALSVFTRAGLAAAQYVLAPVRPRRASLSGTRNMLLTLRTMDALTGTNGRFLGTVLTHWDNLEQFSIGLSRQGVASVGEPCQRRIGGDRLHRHPHGLPEGLVGAGAQPAQNGLDRGEGGCNRRAGG